MRAGKTILLSLLLIITTNLMAQSPLGINYQGVARSADGTPMINQVIGLRVSITSGANGSTDYIEEHHPETNEFGLFNVVVGQGQSSGSISDVDWGAGNKWLQIEVDPQDNANYMFVGSQQMMSVPYALYAAKSGESLTPGFGIDINNGQVNNLLPDKPVTLTGTGSATVSGTYPNFTISTTDNVDDADADPTNEIELPATATANQVLKWNGTNWVAGTDDTNDADADATNELIQSAVLAGTNLELTDAAGTKTVDLSSLQDGTGTDAQNLNSSASGIDRTITISGGTGTTFSVADNDNDSANEIQDISTSGAAGNISLSTGSTLNLNVNDADADAANELLQTAVLTGTNLELTDAAGTKTVDLSSLQDGTGTDAQTLSSSVLTQDTRDLAITGGNNITLNVADNDNNSANELQTISLNTNTLGLSQGGGSVDLSGYMDNTDSQILSSSIAGTTRTINISGGTGTTIDVADNDNDATNELNTAGSYITNNTLRITDTGGNVDIPLGTLNANLDANNNKIVNLSDPVNPQDAVNLQYLEAKDATDYAINVPITFTSLSAANVPLDLSGFTLDKGGLVSGSTITISEPGVYAISVQGVSGLATGSDIDITINGTPTTILKGLNHYLGLYLFDLVTNNTIQIIVRFGSSAETVDLQIAVYKI